MTHTPYTPGDWQRNGNQIVSVHSDEDGDHETLICDVFDQHDWWRANARLIVSAPGMLVALETAEEQLSEYCAGDDGRDTSAWLALRAIRAAIASATGRAL